MWRPCHTITAVAAFMWGLGSAGAATGQNPGNAVVDVEVQASGTETLLIGIDAANESVVWAGGVGGEWLRTVDGGETWRGGVVPGTDSLQFRDVHAVDAETAYLLSIGTGSDSRVYRTDDGGETWALLFENDDPEGFYDCFDFWSPQRGVLIGDEVGLKMSMQRTRNGRDWERIPPGRLPAAQEGEGSFAASGTCLTTGAEGRAWAVASNPEHARLLHTTDYGSTWSVDTLPVTTRAGVGPQTVAIATSDRWAVLTGGYDSEEGDTGFVLSHDGGATWEVRPRPPFAEGVWGAAWVPAAEPSVLVAVGPDGIAVTNDAGEEWTQVDDANYWTLTFGSDRVGWAAGRDGRIVRLVVR
ncbi:MAG: oxidoreductase [Gemmatimonadota bacterium]